MTISEFLLARIAEDEQEITEARIGDGPEWWMPSHWTRERGLAECEAKRRIVEQWDDWDGLVYDGWTNAAQVVLAALASVYADHPDFDTDWRL